MQQCSSYDHMRRICSLHLCRESSSLVLGSSNALAETANVQSGGKHAIKTKFNGSFNHLMLVRILSQQLDNKVHMFVELTKLTFVLLLELLHPGFTMLCGDTFGTIVFQSVNGSAR